MPLTPDIKIRGIRTPIPSGYVLGRTEPGHGDVHLIPIGKVGGVAGVGGGGSGGGGGAGGSSSGASGGTGGGSSGGSGFATDALARNIANQALQLAGYGATNAESGTGDGGDTVPGLPGPAGAAGSSGPAGAGGISVPASPGEDGQDGERGPPGYSPVPVLSLVFVFDGGGAVPAAATLCDLYVPFACTIMAATIQGDVSGSAVVDLWALSGIAAPTISNTIVASAPPTLSSQQAVQNTTLTGWTRAIFAGTSLRGSLTSASVLSRVTVTLTVLKG